MLYSSGAQIPGSDRAPAAIAKRIGDGAWMRRANGEASLRESTIEAEGVQAGGTLLRGFETSPGRDDARTKC